MNSGISASNRCPDTCTNDVLSIGAPSSDTHGNWVTANPCLNRIGLVSSISLSNDMNFDLKCGFSASLPIFGISPCAATNATANDECTGTAELFSDFGSAASGFGCLAAAFSAACLAAVSVIQVSSQVNGFLASCRLR